MVAPSPTEFVQRQSTEVFDRLKAAGLLRCDGPTGVPLSYDLGNNDALAMSQCGAVISCGVDAARAWGAGSRSSRLLGSSHALHDRLSSATSPFLPDGWSSLLLGSGSSANQAFAEAFALLFPNAEVFLDHRCHASLHEAWRGQRKASSVLLFRHRSCHHLLEKLRHSTAEVKLIVVESLHSMDGDFECAETLAACCREVPGCMIFVDEAHTAGNYDSFLWCLSEENRSLLFPHIVGVMAGCGKAVGVSGGLLVVPAELKKACFQVARGLIYTTAPSPFVVAAVAKSCELLVGAEGKKRRAELEKMTEAFQMGLRNLLAAATSEWTFSFQAKSPVMWLRSRSGVRRTRQLAEELGRLGVNAPFIRAPTVPRGTERLRLSVSLHLDVSTVLQSFRSALAAVDQSLSSEKQEK